MCRCQSGLRDEHREPAALILPVPRLAKARFLKQAGEVGDAPFVGVFGVNGFTGGELALATEPTIGMLPVASAPCALKEIDPTIDVHKPAVRDAPPFTSARDWWLVVGLTLGLVAVATWLWVRLQPP